MIGVKRQSWDVCSVEAWSKRHFFWLLLCLRLTCCWFKKKREKSSCGRIHLTQTCELYCFLLRSIIWVCFSFLWLAVVRSLPFILSTLLLLFKGGSVVFCNLLFYFLDQVDLFWELVCLVYYVGLDPSWSSVCFLVFNKFFSVLHRFMVLLVSQ